ncbi:hypothetical protein Q9Q95_10535 [Sphingomonas sp. DG1-23]|uniref:hypothetical protein n=1 Tax=Sphingomonas sp. DG1-23 TaxID=3068316 RepID=UPI00273DFC56|nr:hypothetical protein [Sphingomonas sp. DG1-23]MDP5279358.1 hypothetical protein [Sphingomonas sp. DG1-23]
MQVSVYEGEMLVGTAVLEHLDPPMGVAFGPFSPSSYYNFTAYANTVEGNYVGDRGQSLSTTAVQHGTLATAAIAIADWSASNLGMELTLFLKDGEDFAALFAGHPDYGAYYPHLDEGS